MEKEFVQFGEALALKELGFDESCFSCFYKTGEFTNFFHSFNTNSEVVRRLDAIPAPLYQQAFRWFREKHKIECHIEFEHRKDNGYYFVIEGFFSSPYYSYEEAELECLRELIQIKRKHEKIKR